MSDSDQTLAPVLALLPPNARLLVQAGGGEGAVALSYRRSYPASSYIIEAEDLCQADHHLFRKYEWADGWLFDDTLQLLRDPARVLAQIRDVMQYDASILIRISNNEHWDAPARHALDVPALAALLAQAGLRIATAITLTPPTATHVVDMLRERAETAGQAPQALLDKALPSHFLIKAMPA